MNHILPAIFFYHIFVHFGMSSSSHHHLSLKREGCLGTTDWLVLMNVKLVHTIAVYPCSGKGTSHLKTCFVQQVKDIKMKTPNQGLKFLE